MRSIEQIKADIEECSVTGTQKQLDGFWLEWFRAVANGIEPDRLEAICQAERDGRCVVLPCRVGDTVYITVRGIVEDTKVRTFFMGHPSYHGGELDPRYYMVRLTDYDIPMRDFGKDWFLTRAEAEAALANIQQTNDQTVSKLASSKSVPSLTQVSSKFDGEVKK